MVYGEGLWPLEQKHWFQRRFSSGSSDDAFVLAHSSSKFAAEYAVSYFGSAQKSLAFPVKRGRVRCKEGKIADAIS